MGNFYSLSLSFDDIFSRSLDCIERNANYTLRLEENLIALRGESEKLKEEMNDVRVKVILAEQQQMKRLEQVQGWLSRVELAVTEVPQLLGAGSREVDKLCLGGLCSMNFWSSSSRQVGEQVFETLLELQSLRNEGNFKEVAQPVPENPVDERPIPPTIVGLQSTFDSVWRCLMEEQIGIVGLYGVGGVGKTTLLTQINNKFLDTPKDFDFVIWEVVSKDLQIEKIRDTIAKKIGLFNDSNWGLKKPQEKAEQIFKIMSNKKFVLFLDDIWEPVDLAQVGLPVPKRTSVSQKVIFTTRELDVCGQMEAHKRFKVEFLRYEDAWKLFEEKVGKEIIDSHPDIPELAETMTRECGGLPLALITVGRAMSSKSKPREWEHAIEVLRTSASKFSGMQSRVFARLKLSYDFLPSDAIRFGLLYCSLFPEDYKISVEDLIDCWICESFFDGYNGVEARNRGYDIIRTLVHACLLEEEGEEDQYVKMHDVIRDMVLWIASTIDNAEEKFLVIAGLGLRSLPTIEMWKEVTRVSLMKNNISDIEKFPTSPLLQTLFLSENYLSTLSTNFYESMASCCLRVFKMSNCRLYYNQSLNGISALVSLEHLDVSGSQIESVPLELKNLVNLKCLNLENTSKLSRIPHQVISNLKMLQSLRMFMCGWKVNQLGNNILYKDGRVLVEELLGLEHLNTLTLTLSSFQTLERLACSPSLQEKRTRLSSLYLRYCNERNTGRESLSSRACTHSESPSVLSVARLMHLQTLHFQNICLKEILGDFTGKIQKIREIRGFRSLQTVRITRCNFRDVTWLILAPNLKSLEIEGCYYLEEIISAGKLGEVPADEIPSLVPFGRLESLTLGYLPKLKSIHSSALPFPLLKEILVNGCPELKKPPVDCNNAALLKRKFNLKKILF